MNKKILTSITLLFILAVICTAVLPTSVAEATQYGDVNSDDYWYYKSAHLNVAGMKESYVYMFSACGFTEDLLKLVGDRLIPIAIEDL